MSNGVEIRSSARLHFNSIDMNGFSGRAFGGLGLGIKRPCVKITIEPSNKMEIKGTSYPRKVERVVKTLDEKFNLGRSYKINVIKEIKEHIGLGSETQLLASTAKGIFYLNGKEMPFEEVCPLLGIGRVSGIGTGVFRKGGFIIDGGFSFGPGKEKETLGQTEANRIPKTLVNYDFPEEWKILLVIPRGRKSVSGKEEKRMFRENTPVPIEEVKSIAYYTLMGIQPGIVEKDFDLFIKSLEKVASLGTKKVELKINEDLTKKILGRLEEELGFGGLSSLGPTCYSFINTEEEEINLKRFKNLFQNSRVILTEASNRSHQVIEK